MHLSDPNCVDQLSVGICPFPTGMWVLIVQMRARTPRFYTKSLVDISPFFLHIFLQSSFGAYAVIRPSNEQISSRSSLWNESLLTNCQTFAWVSRIHASTRPVTPSYGNMLTTLLYIHLRTLKRKFPTIIFQACKTDHFTQELSGHS